MYTTSGQYCSLQLFRLWTVGDAAYERKYLYAMRKITCINSWMHQHDHHGTLWSYEDRRLQDGVAPLMPAPGIASPVTRFPDPYRTTATRLAVRFQIMPLTSNVCLEATQFCLAVSTLGSGPEHLHKRLELCISPVLSTMRTWSVAQ
jgi:hypothetical protein